MDCKNENIDLLISQLQQQSSNQQETLKQLSQIIKKDKVFFKQYLNPLFETLLISIQNENKFDTTQFLTEIIQIYLSDIDQYIVPVLEHVVINLGDEKPQVRKQSHSCLLQYVRAAQNFDKISSAFKKYGLSHSNGINKQKAINSFQSLLISESRLLNWNSYEFKLILEQIIQLTVYEQENVSKASEQALLTLLKEQGFRIVCKRLDSDSQNLLKNFIEIQKQKGIIPENFTIDTLQQSNNQQQQQIQQQQQQPQNNFQNSNINNVQMIQSQQQYNMQSRPHSNMSSKTTGPSIMSLNNNNTGARMQTSSDARMSSTSNNNINNINNNFNVSAQSSSNPFQNVGQNIANFNITNNFLNQTNMSNYSQQQQQQMQYQQQITSMNSGFNTQYSNFSSQQQQQNPQIQQQFPQQSNTNYNQFSYNNNTNNNTPHSSNNLQSSNTSSPHQTIKKEYSPSKNIGIQSLNILNSNNKNNNNNQQIDPIQNQISPQQQQMQQNPKIYTHCGILTQVQYDSLNDQSDWKVRQNTMEQILENVQSQYVKKELEPHFKEFIILMTKMINDQNFKTSLTALNVLNNLVSLSAFNDQAIIDMILPKLSDKLGDSKIAVRQATSQIITDHFAIYKRTQFIDHFVKYLKSKNQHIKEEVLNLLIFFYNNEDYIPYNCEKLLNDLAPLMEDSKTKIKTNTLDCLISITMKNNIKQCQGILSQKLNQVYFNMYQEKLQKAQQLLSENPKKYAHKGFNMKNQQPEKFRSSSRNSNQDSYQGGISNMGSTDKSSGNSEYYQMLSDSKFSTGNSMQRSNNILNSQNNNNSNNMQNNNNNNINGNKPNNYNAGQYLSDLSSASSSRSTQRPFTNNSINGLNQQQQNIQQRNQQLLLEQQQQNKINNLNADSINLSNNSNNNQNLQLQPPPNIMSQNNIAQNENQKHPGISSQNELKSQQNSNLFHSQNENNSNINQQNEANQENQDSAFNLYKTKSQPNQQQQQQYNPEIYQNNQPEQEEEMSIGNYNPSSQDNKKAVRKLNNNNNQEQSNLSESEINKQKQLLQNPNQAQQQQQQKIQIKNNIFNPPINMFTKQNSNDTTNNNSNPEKNNILEDKQEQQQYQYKPPLAKKSSTKNYNNNKLNNINNNNITNNINNNNNNLNIEDSSEGLIIQSKEYQNKNQINNDSNVNNNNNNYDESPKDDQSLLSNNLQAQKQKNIFKINRSTKKSISSNSQTEETMDIDDIKDREEASQQQIKSEKLSHKVFKRKTEQKSTTSKLDGMPSPGGGISDYKQLNYQSYAQLQPLVNHEQQFKQMKSDIKIDDWQKQFESLNICRRILKHHSQTILSNANTFSGYIGDTLKLIDNLRSSIAKNSMITIQELSEKYKRLVDPSLEKIFAKLLKKGLDTNVFILEEVRKSMVSLCLNQSENKLIPYLLQASNTKNSPTKIHIVLCFETIVERFQSNSQFQQNVNFDKIVHLIGSWITESSAEVRNNSKKVFSSLVRYTGKQEILKISKRIFNEHQFKKISDFTQQIDSFQPNVTTDMFSDISSKLKESFSNSYQPLQTQQQPQQKQKNNNSNNPFAQTGKQNFQSSISKYTQDDSKSNNNTQYQPPQLQLTKFKSTPQKQSEINENQSDSEENEEEDEEYENENYDSEDSQNQNQNKQQQQRYSSNNQINSSSEEDGYQEKQSKLQQNKFNNVRHSNEQIKNNGKNDFKQTQNNSIKSKSPTYNKGMSATTILKPGGPRSSTTLIKDPQIFEDLPQIYAIADNTDWNKRYELVNTLTKLAEDYPKNIMKPKHSQKYLDTYRKLLSDSNIKVSINALKNFQNIITTIKQAIEQNILIIGTCIMVCLGSNNISIQNQANAIFEIFVENIDLPILYPLVCNQAQYGSQKTRTNILKKMGELTLETNEIKPNFVGKHLAGVIIKGLGDTNKDIKQYTRQLIFQTHDTIGDLVLAEIPQNKKASYKDVIEK